ncbi:CHAT domain-containing protein [Phenylobacterium sp.]|uniref:CHAT domain-containing protein n=1 Tax=Phenylobacterium sp. TaxID=1871053 RepID=UPI00289E6273|nr:CHAT domain-containing protein [Phenylobacterium sp.]
MLSSQPAVAAGPAPSPWGLYFQGKGQTARELLERRLGGEELDPAARREAMATLLEICIHSRARDCILEQVPKYVALPAPPAANELMRREDVRRTGYFLDYGKFTYGAAPVTAGILAGDLWRQENAANAGLYLRRQLLASNIQLEQGDHAAAGTSLDKILSLVASLKTPQDDAFLVAWALSDVIDSLRVLGQSDRAYGVYRASGRFIAASLPPLSVDAMTYRLVEAELLLEQGQFAQAVAVLDAAAATARAIELDEASRAYMIAQAMTRKAAACASLLRLDCARDAIDAHPYGKLYARAGRTPADFEETAYLAARALTAAIEQRPDPVAAKALAEAAPYEAAAGANAEPAAIYRTAGRALALPPGAERQAGLAQTGRLIVAAAKRAPSLGVGMSRRPAALEQILISFALSQADAAGAEADETNFALFQMAGRIQANVDADALTALSQAKDALQRRSIHQGLRLRARRDAFERGELAKLATRPPTPGAQALLTHDVATRGVLRDFAVRLGEIDGELGPATSGSDLIELKRFQAALRPGEAALSVAMVPGGMAYMCVRRDRVERLVAPADWRQATLDIKILQAALTAGHAPSDALDAQFPAAAAVRMHGLLIAPFDGCVQEGDHLLWLANASITPLPLSVLLPQAPPKLGEGYDLARADWLVRRHAVSYAGSPSAILAARSGALAPASDFDFLGVGDPVLSGATDQGEDRARMLLQGARSAGLAALAPLPETKDELERSAKGFATTKLLVQSAATERGVRGQLLGSYRYLSFATHGLIRDELEGLSEPALALTPVSSSDPLDDGLLTASEIADLNLGARFVALSACNTANYDVAQMAGELPALASAFAVAGVPSTLGSLWAVDSETTKEVVATTFATLRSEHGESPALALAGAQRAFLAAPPSRAYLHPRFWAPLIVLGDGARPPPPAPSSGVVTVEPVTTEPGEVIALRRSGGEVLTRFSDAGAQPVSGVAMSGRWRRETRMAAPTRLLVEQESSIIVGGGEKGADGRLAPVLETLDKASGAVRAIWRGEAAEGMDSLVAAGVALGPARVLVALADSAARTRGAGQAAADGLRVMQIDAGQAPRLLFTVVPPQPVAIEDATLTPMGDRLLVTYTVRHPASPRRPLGEDDYELAPCMGVPITWTELREIRTGALISSRQLTGWTAPTALAHDGRVLLGGGFMESCEAELKAGVIALDDALRSTMIYRDESLGWSEVRALGAMDGGALIAAAKLSQVDYRPEPADRRDPYAPGDMRTHVGGMLVRLEADGSLSAPKLLDSGSNIYLSAADASRPGEALLGGSLGGAAVVFRLTTAGEP